MQRVRVVDLQHQTGDDRTCVWEGEGVQIMRARLAPREVLPPHNAVANVVLIPIAGRLAFANDEESYTWGVGEALAVACDTPMRISNAGDEPALMLVVKSPPPG